MKLRKKQIDNVPVYVTQPSLAPFSDFIEKLRPSWESGILTHNGPLVQKFEKEIAKKLKVNNYVAVSNGTIALQMAIKALDLNGEIIVPAFTWIASISAIKWEGCKPVFCDIDKNTLNIDENLIEELITEKTVAIMPVHVFGNPCNAIAIERIAEKHNLKVIYDAAHAMGSKFDNKSILEFGDISATSTHATKLLNTAEGGGCITTNKELDSKLKRIRFFGHSEDKRDIVEDGFNGKMTEVHAAIGLSNINYYDQVLEDRKYKYELYQTELSNVKDIVFQRKIFGTSNFSYFPIILSSESLLLKIVKTLNAKGIFPRRYFYPSVNTFSIIKEKEACPVSEDISNRILCLPLYFLLEKKTILKISKLIISSI
ncbi:MAG: aminotransferase DegT [Crocinitomicaceae bacterium]|nr:aminotransferase DegT [Crocinitomicaceae bacterium]|tara:strand:+ start:2977 stop:4089 length:1113 start_codon:yes stop_codon:yes gene_type:complete